MRRVWKPSHAGQAEESDKINYDLAHMLSEMDIEQAHSPAHIEECTNAHEQFPQMMDAMILAG